MYVRYATFNFWQNPTGKSSNILPEFCRIQDSGPFFLCNLSWNFIFPIVKIVPAIFIQFEILSHHYIGKSIPPEGYLQDFNKKAKNPVDILMAEFWELELEFQNRRMTISKYSEGFYDLNLWNSGWNRNSTYNGGVTEIGKKNGIPNLAAKELQSYGCHCQQLWGGHGFIFICIQRLLTSHFFKHLKRLAKKEAQ
jgi:hypothetical protein